MPDRVIIADKMRPAQQEFHRRAELLSGRARWLAVTAFGPLTLKWWPFVGSYGPIISRIVIPILDCRTPN